MIESRYWRRDLQKIADSLRDRWVYIECDESHEAEDYLEEKLVLLEKDILTGFFWTRKLFHSHKITDLSRTHSVPVLRHRRTAKPFTVLNHYDVDELYDLSKVERTTLSINSLCNQFIHSYLIFVTLNSDESAYEQVLVCSDYEKEKYIYRVEFKDIAKAFETVASDRPNKFVATYDQNGEVKLRSE